MQGVFIHDGSDFRRPKSKREITSLIASGGLVVLEDTSIFGNEYGGPVDRMPEGTTAYFVGPDPYTRRTFYGSLKRVGYQIIIR